MLELGGVGAWIRELSGGDGDLGEGIVECGAWAGVGMGILFGMASKGKDGFVNWEAIPGNGKGSP